MSYVIASLSEKDDETNEPLYWNDEQGWVGFSAASIYEQKPHLMPAESQCEPYRPWSILYSREGEIYNCGPFATEDSAMAWANDNRYQGADGDQDAFEFDLDDEHVYLLGPDHRIQELSNSDFPEVDWRKNLAAGDEVQWNDPDEGTCSRILTIRNIRWEGDDVFVIEDVDGSVVQGFIAELE